MTNWEILERKQDFGLKNCSFHTICSRIKEVEVDPYASPKGGQPPYRSQKHNSDSQTPANSEVIMGIKKLKTFCQKHKTSNCYKLITNAVFFIQEVMAHWWDLAEDKDSIATHPLKILQPHKPVKCGMSCHLLFSAIPKNVDGTPLYKGKGNPVGFTNSEEECRTINRCGSIFSRQNMPEASRRNLTPKVMTGHLTAGKKMVLLSQDKNPCLIRACKLKSF